MPKPLRLPDDDRPRKKKKPAPSDGLPVGPLIGIGVGAVLLLGLVAVVWWAVNREGPPPPKPLPPAAPPPAAPAAPTPPTQPKPPTADELYQWLVGGTWVQTADDKVLGGQRTTRLTFLADKTLVVKQAVPNPLAGLGGGDAAVDTAVTVNVTAAELVPDSRVLKLRTDDASLLGAGFKRFRLRFETDGRISLTEPGDESRFQATPYTREKGQEGR